MVKAVAFSIGILALALVVGPLEAHHGRGDTYDMGTELTLMGKVSQVSWRNPHVVIFMDVEDEDGNVVTWGFENAGVSRLARLGYGRNTLKVGQEITAVVNPSAAGAPTAIVVEVLLEDGSIIMSRRRGGNPLD